MATKLGVNESACGYCCDGEGSALQAVWAAARPGASGWCRPGCEGGRRPSAGHHRVLPEGSVIGPARHRDPPAGHRRDAARHGSGVALPRPAQRPGRNEQSITGARPTGGCAEGSRAVPGQAAERGTRTVLPVATTAALSAGSAISWASTKTCLRPAFTTRARATKRFPCAGARKFTAQCEAVTLPPVAVATKPQDSLAVTWGFVFFKINP